MSGRGRDVQDWLDQQQAVAAGAPLRSSYHRRMSTNVRIEVDEQTADVLRVRAAELGVTVSELVAELATLEAEPVTVDDQAVAELDRRWKKVQSGEQTVSHEGLIRWLRTWGTPRFRPWRAQ